MDLAREAVYDIIHIIHIIIITITKMLRQ